MADLLIRGIGAETKRRLEAQAQKNGRSQSAEALCLLERGLDESAPDWVDILRNAAVRAGGFDLELPPRAPGREIDTSEWGLS